MNACHIGVVLVNTGTPEELSIPAIRSYLARFLSDRRIVRLPPLVWKPILHGIVLRSRPRRTLPRYEKLWTPNGARYTLISRNQARFLEQKLNVADSPAFTVRCAHRYGNPSLAVVIDEMEELGVDELLILPLYPQSAYSTTASVHDELERVMQTHPSLPPIRFIDSYGDSELYLQAIAAQIRHQLQRLPAAAAHQKPYHGVFSFHSIPHADIRDGDDYFDQVKRSVTRIIKAADLNPEQWTLSFASRFDRRSWLGPFTSSALSKLATENYRSLIVICPGFATDCIETLVEIDDAGRNHYLEHAARAYPDAPHDFYYLSALNDTPAHIAALASVVHEALNGQSISSAR